MEMGDASGGQRGDWSILTLRVNGKRAILIGPQDA